MQAPNDRKYTAEHEWVLELGEGRIRVGITDFAQDQLGDVVYVELPTVGAEVAKGAGLAEVESTKSVGDVYAPIAGTVVAVNEALNSSPELINSDPFGEGWIFELEGDLSPLADLLDAEQYQAQTE